MECDNKRYIFFAKNPKKNSRTKLIDIQHHFIWEKIEMGVINMRYCITKDIIPNLLTKSLIKDKHYMLRKALRLKAFDQ